MYQYFSNVFKNIAISVNLQQVSCAKLKILTFISSGTIMLPHHNIHEFKFYQFNTQFWFSLISTWHAWNIEPIQ